MSSILKALKKIEIQSRKTTPDHKWSSGIDTRRIITASAAKRWRMHRYSSIVLLGLVLIGAGWLVWAQKARIYRYLAPTESGIGVSTPAGADRAGAAAGTAPRANPADPSTASSVAPTVRPAPGKAAASDVSAKRPVRRPSTESGAQSTPATPASKPTKTVSNTAKPAPATLRRANKALPSPAQSAAQKRPTTYDNLSRLTGDALNLQAIAWAKAPAQRMAVINDRIVREGDSVDSFVVRRIRADDVIVSDGSGSYRLVFGLQSP